MNHLVLVGHNCKKEKSKFIIKDILKNCILAKHKCELKPSKFYLIYIVNSCALILSYFYVK